MNKELNHLLDSYIDNENFDYSCYISIENKLKAYYELESMHEELAKAYNKLCAEKLEWLKEKKVLEIMKKYKHFQSFFAFNPTYKDYQANMSIYEDEELMSEEEYDLLKEVLL